MAGCASTEPRLAESPDCEIGVELLTRCEPPRLPTVHTLEQFDVAFTEAYMCTNQLNAQLEEIRQRCTTTELARGDATVAVRTRQDSPEPSLSAMP